MGVPEPQLVQDLALLEDKQAEMWSVAQPGAGRFTEQWRPSSVAPAGQEDTYGNQAAHSPRICSRTSRAATSGAAAGGQRSVPGQVWLAFEAKHGRAGLLQKDCILKCPHCGLLGTGTSRQEAAEQCHNQGHDPLLLLRPRLGAAARR